MKVINQSSEVMSPSNPTEYIEKIARVCYKSEDKIGKGTDKKIVRMLYKNEHLAMLEHYRFIMLVNNMVYDLLEHIDHPYINMTRCNNRNMISFSATALINLVKMSNAEHHGILPMSVKCVQEELMYHIIKKYNCPELFGLNDDDNMILSTPVEFVDMDTFAFTDSECRQHMWYTVKFITDRGVTHELVRHRTASFAQESTRYCNYGDNDILFINPFVEEDISEDDYRYIDWIYGCSCSESAYKRMVGNGCTPQYARSVLVNSVKSEIVVTANVAEWDHIFSLRCDEPAHPMMKDLMIPLFRKMTDGSYNKNIWKDCYNREIKRKVY